MRLTIPNCPTCSEVADRSIDFIQGDAGLSAVEEGATLDFDYAGETEVNWDGQGNALDLVLSIMGNIENMNDFALVGCRAGHRWITGVVRPAEEQEPTP